MSASSSWINYIVYNCCYFLIIILSAFYPLTPTAAQPPPEYPPTTTAIPSSTWTLDYDYNHNSYYESEITIEKVSGYFKFILPTDLRYNVTTRSALGFFCPFENRSCTSYFFSILIFSEEGTPSPLVWSANRDYPVNNHAILNFTSAGELVLRDTNGKMVWTTNSAGKSVIGMNLTDTGNLVLYDANNQVVWQSFDHPTDCLLPGQRLYQGQKLISSTNWTSQKGMYSLQVTDEGLFAYVESNPPQAYFSRFFAPDQLTETNINKGKSYVRFLNGSLSFFIYSTEPSDPDDHIYTPPASSAQYMKLMPDGHLKVFELQSDDWKQVDDLLTTYLGECGYPLACGRNALCLNDKQCRCPISNAPGIEYFRAVNDREPNLGCSEITPLTCNATQDQDLFQSRRSTTSRLPPT